jgi:hypothetical protein
LKTGEVFDRDKEGLWLCESWEEDGIVHTTRTLVEPEPEPEPEPDPEPTP